MRILICNAGSTSLKFQLLSMPEETVLAAGRIERVGSPCGGLFVYEAGADRVCRDEAFVAPNYEAGIRAFLEKLTDARLGAVRCVDEIDYVGFKTVLSKGFYGTHVLDEAVLRGMEEYMTVAPAHNRHYLEAIRTFEKVLPGTPRIGAFETAFHQTMPPQAYIYSAPYAWYEKYGIRRLGYHGASHSYVADCLTQRLGPSYKAVSCHLGGSGSLCAIVDGRSVDTSFGLSLQTGLPQMSRSGDLDPFIINYLIQKEGLRAEEVFHALETEGGMLGISGVSNDMRDLEAAEADNPRAKLALDIYCREVARYIGGYAAIMNGLDCIAFTGGIGEKSARVRDAVLGQFVFMGFKPASSVPDDGVRLLSAPDSAVAVYVIPANEELGIARKIYGMFG